MEGLISIKDRTGSFVLPISSTAKRENEMGHLKWGTDLNGSILAVQAPFTAVVTRPKDEPFARFIVKSPHDTGVDMLVESGTADNVRQAMRRAEAAIHRRRGAIAHSPKLVMIVDSDARMRRSLGERMRKRDYRTIELSSKEEAATYLEQKAHPDIVIVASEIVDRHGDRQLLHFFCADGSATNLVLQGPNEIPEAVVAGIVRALLDGQNSNRVA
ncbi:MAG TPA: hypothetical protein VHB27_02735 [Rhodopila sp.]|uniref:hypothetical protein n=1 Tax=Rhodopila sp. TaxID=2480087 RepID=UPI002CC54223|nr:hypothetical protein [Rhodopila sp.]HVY14118.1 hypothetical protein [Rhodopila sp.]